MKSMYTLLLVGVFASVENDNIPLQGILIRKDIEKEDGIFYERVGAVFVSGMLNDDWKRAVII